MVDQTDIPRLVEFLVDGGLQKAFEDEEVRDYCLRTLADMGCTPPTNRMLLFCCVRAATPVLGFALKAAGTNLTGWLYKHERIAALLDRIASICRTERDKDKLKSHLMALMRGESPDPPPLDEGTDLAIVQSLYQSQILQGLDAELKTLAGQLVPALASAIAALQLDPVETLMDQWQDGDTSAIGDRIRYNSGLHPFVGRADEIDLLTRFLGEPVAWSRERAFRWLLLHGDGGTGKTRLALEFVRHQLPPGWVGRRLPDSELQTMIDAAPHWLPKAPTLIVIDYPAQRPEAVRTLLTRLHRRAPAFDFQLRVLLLERDAADSWFDKAIPQTGDGAPLRGCVHVADGMPLLHGHRLAPPDWADIVALIDELLGHLPAYADHREALLRYLAQLDPRPDGAAPRPLFVLAVAEWLRERYTQGKPWHDLLHGGATSEELLGEIIARDRQAFWQPLADRQHADLAAHERMLALAGFTLGLPDPLRIAAAAADLGLAHLFPTQPDLALLKRLSDVRDGRLRELEPDLLGEFLTLDHLDRLRTVEASAVARFCRLAYRIGGDTAAVVALRYLRDFPQKLAALDWLAPDGSAVEGEVAPFAGFCGDAMPSLDTTAIAVVSSRLESLIGHCAPDNADGAIVRFATAMNNKGITLGRLERPRDEIAVYDDLVARFGDSPLPALQEQAAGALFNKGITLGELNRSDDAIAVYDDLVARFGDSPLPMLQEQIAKALVNKGVRLSKLDRSDDAIAVYDDLVARFGDSPLAALQEQVAKALVNKGISLALLIRPTEAVAVCDEVMARFGDSPLPALQEQVAKAQQVRAIAMGQQ